MNRNQIEGNLMHPKSNLKRHWIELTDDQLDAIAGKRHHLARKTQKADGVIKHDSENQLSDWQDDTNIYNKDID